MGDDVEHMDRTYCGIELAYEESVMAIAAELETKPKRHYPALILGTLGGLLVPAVKWLYTHELSPGDFMIAAVPIVMGALTTTQVTPVKDMVPVMAEKVGEATVLVAKRIDAIGAGAPGTVTPVAEKIATEVTAQVTGAKPSLAGGIIARVKAKVAGAGV
jgi:hypothetical protein